MVLRRGNVQQLILGTDIDVCDGTRLRPWLAQPDGDLIAAVFTADEIACCRGKRHPARHFAARFAAASPNWPRVSVWRGCGFR